MRKFAKVSTYPPESIKLPIRATIGSAGYDFYARTNITIKPNETVVHTTGVKCYMEDDDVLKIYLRSSIGAEDILIPGAASVIDSDYVDNIFNEGDMRIVMRNVGDTIFHIAKGDRIAQGIFEKFYKTDDDVTTALRKGGMGSSGK